MRRYTMMNRIARSLGVAAIALAVVVGVIAFGSTDAAAQGFNVVTFECVAGADLDADLRGLGNTNICLVFSAAVESDCACVNVGGNCPKDTHKQTTTTTQTSAVAVEPKNGRIDDIFDAAVAGGGCAALQDNCGTGQTARAIIQTTTVSWTACTTTAEAGAPCNCGTPPVSDIGASVSGATDPDCQTSTIGFAGKKSSCLNLFQ
jgi:hypothetical protein